MWFCQRNPASGVVYNYEILQYGECSIYRYKCISTYPFTHNLNPWKGKTFKYTIFDCSPIHVYRAVNHFAHVAHAQTLWIYFYFLITKIWNHFFLSNIQNNPEMFNIQNVTLGLWWLDILMKCEMKCLWRNKFILTVGR